MLVKLPQHLNAPETGWTTASFAIQPDAQCQLCGKKHIRKVFTMEHSNYRTLHVGSVCASKMGSDMDWGDPNRTNRLINWMKKEWYTSKQNNNMTITKTIAGRKNTFTTTYNRRRGYKLKINGTVINRWFKDFKDIQLIVFKIIERNN